MLPPKKLDFSDVPSSRCFLALPPQAFLPARQQPRAAGMARYKYRAAAKLTHDCGGNEGTGAETEMETLPVLIRTTAVVTGTRRGAGVTIARFARFSVGPLIKPANKKLLIAPALPCRFRLPKNSARKMFFYQQSERERDKHCCGWGALQLRKSGTRYRLLQFIVYARVAQRHSWRPLVWVQVKPWPQHTRPKICTMQ